MERQLEDLRPTADAWKNQDDKPLPEDPEIEAAFPTESGRHDLYGTAMRLVGARFTKGGLVALVNWLLHRIEAERKNARMMVRTVDGHRAQERRLEEEAKVLRARVYDPRLAMLTGSGGTT